MHQNSCKFYFILSSLISDSYVIQGGSISYQTNPFPPPLTPPSPRPPTSPTTPRPLQPPLPPGRVLCTVLVTIS